MKVLWTDGKMGVFEKEAGMDMTDVYEDVRMGLDLKKYSGESQNDLEFCRRSGVAHRLDKETSGCLLVGSDPKVLSFLMDQFREKKIKKEYVALVHGRMEPASGVVRLPLRRSRSNRLKREVGYDGKVAETTWRVEKYFRDYSLVRLWPLTGRMHQIRVHLSHLGYPIFGDLKYLSKGLLMEDRLRLDRHFLHAEKIEFFDLSGRKVEVESELPADAVRLLSMLE
jgi:23S rRNA pseudouridine1911/1915/1917 synthase